MKKPWTKVGTKVYILTPWGEIQIGTRYRTISVWHRRKLYRVKGPVK